ncbi:UDP-glucose/GDP-mannose dehydrogenase family protein [Paenibacillus alvei]|uniref:UDP-glucose dehydrogenase family protein n=1 Tax=Paenibacillus alvei TaxID=44250 RepID=UPI0018CD159E|nr:UDP-glucose/GDP-mannose dehydrogenase family protein [Paenibacillus alvei]MBG9737715.1 UDP-glucose 6-dehydrogenase [Paenibacillus alvei]MBG9747407.1 UDP-glucose 6-dehydrogenase [Paenibacillus alvei]MCY9581079.1 UDP-glucose/GDP-mannose dehydrogenase family protein [Paenibacillus alvei]MCY9585797.1 UDP-glucose/GDP-mannose dehydrogenase family protein [Paenibacillus alvei]
MNGRSIAVVGTGYVGLVSGVCFAHVGHRVVCCDIDEQKIAMLQRGEIPIYEPGLDGLVRETVEAGRLSFTFNTQEAILQADVIFIAVGTPMSDSGEADLTYVRDAAAMIARYSRGYKIIVTKSTVPVGTGRMLADLIRHQAAADFSFDVVSNPEFLREGSAVHDCLNMERAIIGSDSDYASRMIESLHEPFGTVVLRTSLESAEMIKYASNAFLAMKISYINSIANLCEKMGADVQEVAHGMGLDSRIGGKFLQAGIGYGGSCFPKDTYALRYMAKHAECEFPILHAVIETNEKQRLRVVERLKHELGMLRGKHICVLGLAFKPNTNDMREAPSLTIIPLLERQGAIVHTYDPIAEQEARLYLGDSPHYHRDVYAAVTNCDAAIIVTEWDEIKQADLEMIHTLMKYPLVVDGRNCMNPLKMEEHGFQYFAIGRPAVSWGEMIRHEVVI